MAPHPPKPHPELDPVLVAWGRNVKAARQAQQLGQREFSRRLGVQPETVWRWEHGHREPNRERRLRIAEILDANVDDLFPYYPDLDGIAS